MTENQNNKWQQHVDWLLTQKTITAAHFKHLDEQGQLEIKKELNTRLEKVNNDYLRLSHIMGEVMQLNANRMVWENNHLKIMRAMQTIVGNNGIMPSPTYIAEVTGLSRQTVAKHIAEAEDPSIFAEHIKSYSFIAPQVLTRVAQAAISGNRTVPGMKLYFDLLEKMQGKTQAPALNAQNNYIQINNTTLKQETLQQLSPEHLKQIEEILQKYLPQASAEKEE